LIWTNWAGNQRFEADQLFAADEEEIIDHVRRAAESGSRLRVAGAGHSWTPIVESSGSLLTLTGPRGLIEADPVVGEAEIWGHTPLREVGAALWSHGLALRNQGDLDLQTLAGATATGTKGSGRGSGSLSSEIVAMTIIDGHGRQREIGGDDEEELRAARVSLGLLGIVTRIRLRVDRRYGLREENDELPVDEAIAAAEERLQRYRHFSLFWTPGEQTGAIPGLPPTRADHCFVKQLAEIPGDHPDLAVEPGIANADGVRSGRSYLVYPDWVEQEGDHLELEYMVPADAWSDAFLSVRDLILERHPLQPSPVQVRWQRQDDGFLSAQNGTDVVSIALGSSADEWGEAFLRDVHRTLLPFRPRPHWGKMHYFTPEQIAGAFPDLDRFREVRERFDPDRVFVNEHLERLLVDGAAT